MSPAATTLDFRRLRHIRIGFLVLAAILGILGIWLVATAPSATNVMTTTGKVLALEGLFSRCGYGPRCLEGHYYRYTQSQCKADPLVCDPYEGSVLSLAHDTNQYVINPFTLRPILTEWFASSGDTVRLWYTQTPVLGPQVVAIQMYGARGQANVLHTSAEYTDAPAVHNALQAIGTAILTGAALAAMAGWLVPFLARRSEGLANWLDVTIKPANTADSPAPADQ